MISLIRRILTVLTLVAILAVGFSSPSYAASDTEAYFAFKTFPNEPEFVIKLTDPAKIQKARDILSGKETDEVHVLGRINKQPASYNPGWSFNYNPDTISFFTMAIEVCDSSTQYLEDHLDEAGGAFLPGAFWCPWSSQLVREVKAS